MSLFIGNMYLGATIKQQCGKEFDQKVDFVTKEVGGGHFRDFGKEEGIPSSTKNWGKNGDGEKQENKNIGCQHQSIYNGRG